MDSHIAEFVYATAGRDKGECFIVIAQEENFLYLCNGKSRKVSNPKKKKTKHVCFTEKSDEFISTKLASTGKLTNKEVRYALSGFQSSLSDEQE